MAVEHLPTHRILDDQAATVNAAVPYLLLADLVLALHCGVALFVVGGLAAVLIGNRCGWSWVNGLRFRLIHLAAIAVIAGQAWLGRLCPLTTLEMWLREQAGAATYSGSFIGYWLQTLLYWDAPAWVFILVYTLFGLAVVASWWYYPPRRR